MTTSARSLLRSYNIRPKKSLGQNFLHDSIWLERIVAGGDVGSDDLVLEIGSGAGSLTRCLALAAREVVTIEIDKRFEPVIEHALKGFENVTVVTGDILDYELRELLSGYDASNFKVISNIPYYITGKLVRHLLQGILRPSVIVLTVQREVAARMMAEVGEMSMLAVSVQFFCSARVLAHVPASVFYPSPDVDSSIMRLDVLPQSAWAHPDHRRFFSVVRSGFTHRRKQIQNAFAQVIGLPREQIVGALQAAGVDPRRRAQTLSIPEWARITDCMATLTD